MRLIFVYNANAGLMAGIMDSVHKAVSPDTYPCSLCAISYGAFAMKPRWREWLKTLPMPMHFYHRPDFHAAFPEAREMALPLVALDHDGRLEPLLDAAQLDALGDLEGLIAAMEARLKSLPRE